ncbi:pancreatic triacylglycerol lipase [Aethina tumida]|uniref:pancreatic triacylglycerol lipase n=1 Tax=Aethina tumida TaxID=116153 RepID=UPI00096B2451|nr:pancreatic triacylglycerol lipase [Aethina tumida]
MNLFNQIIGLAFNLISLPFGHNSQFDLENSITKPMQLNALSPINMLRRAGLASCRSMLFQMGENNLKFSFLPKGYCSNCCPLRADRDVRFVLYNRRHRTSGVPVEPYNEAGAASRAGLDVNASTVVFIHGFTEPSPGESGTAIVDAYLSRPEPYNVILVDWSDLGAFPWYRTAVQNVKLVGTLLKEFIETFHSSGELNVGTLHVVGFSLGCHIASHAGKQLKGVKLPRITALDPAFPEFSLEDPSKRLTQSDAEYIDVIHTDGGVLGFPLAIGHADFYPNGGRALQPGCQPSYLVQLRLIDQVLACSHVRAWRLYAESVRNPTAFPATRCKSWRGTSRQCNFTQDAFMGFGCNKTTRGQYYLLTKHKSPYSKTVAEQTVVK